VYDSQNNTCNVVPTPHSGTSKILDQIPTSLSIVAGTDSTTSEATCPVGSSTGCGVTRSFTYQVMDQESPAKPIQSPGIANMQFWDSFQITSPNNLGVTGSVTTCSPANTGPCNLFVNSQGQFLEKSLSVCSTVCYNSSTKMCVTGGPTNANQTWHIGSYSIVQQISLYCDHVLVNGH
ncbi:MAG: hypothetical protein ACRD1J_08660, partial [Terriglobia bacterium]